MYDLLHTLNLFKSNKACFFCTSLMFWGCAETYGCNRTPHMPKTVTFLTIFGVTEILCNFKLVVEGKAGKEIPE